MLNVGQMLLEGAPSVGPPDDYGENDRARNLT